MMYLPRQDRQASDPEGMTKKRYVRRDSETDALLSVEKEQ